MDELVYVRKLPKGGWVRRDPNIIHMSKDVPDEWVTLCGRDSAEYELLEEVREPKSPHLFSLKWEGPFLEPVCSRCLAAFAKGEADG